MKNGLPIGARLGIGFAIVIALLGGIVATAMQSLAALNRVTGQIIDDRYPQVVLATELLLQLNENAIVMRNMLLADGPAVLRRETAAAASQALQDRSGQLAQLVSTFRLDEDLGQDAPPMRLQQRRLAA